MLLPILLILLLLNDNEYVGYNYVHIHIYARIEFSDLWQWKVGNGYKLIHEEYDK